MKRTKYRSTKIVIDNITFDSAREANRYLELKYLLVAKQIEGLELQPKFPLNTIEGRPVLIKSKGYPNGRHATYFGDFKYFDNQKKEWIFEDVKGIDTPLSRHKRAHVEAQYLITINLI